MSVCECQSKAHQHGIWPACRKERKCIDPTHIHRRIGVYITCHTTSSCILYNIVRCVISDDISESVVDKKKRIDETEKIQIQRKKRNGPNISFKYRPLSSITLKIATMTSLLFYIRACAPSTPSPSSFIHVNSQRPLKPFGC